MYKHKLTLNYMFIKRSNRLQTKNAFCSLNCQKVLLKTPYISISKRKGIMEVKLKK